MLWNGNLAYVFMPRTGSRSLNAHFAATWQNPIFGTASPAQLREITSRSTAPTFVRLGRGHYNLKQLANQLYRHGRTLRQMERIIFVIRNPYHLVSSNYFFLRDQAAAGSTSKNATMAYNCKFEEFCAEMDHPDPANWLKMEGKMLSNMHMIRFESLSADIADLDRTLGHAETPLVHLNRAKIAYNYCDHYTDRSEKIVYDKYRALFEIGHYSRGEGL